MDEVTDGRALIRSTNRDRVVEAILSMFVERVYVEGDYEGIGKRAGVSARTVYRLFEDRELLYRIAIIKYLDRIRDDLVITGIGQGGFDDRAHQFIEHRIALFEKHFALAWQLERSARSTESELIGAFRGLRQEFLREQVRLQFAPELGALPKAEATTVLALLDNVFQFESLSYFIDQRKSSANEVRALLSYALRVALGGVVGSGAAVPAEAKGAGRGKRP